MKIIREMQRDEVERIANIMGGSSASAEALEEAKSRKGNVRFFIAEDKGQRYTLVVPGELVTAPSQEGKKRR